MSEKVFFVTDVESTGPCFVQHDMYQFASVPVLEDGTVLDEKGLVFNVQLHSYNPKNHDPETLSFLRDELGITLHTLRLRELQVTAETAMVEFNRTIAEALQSAGAKKPIFVADNLAFDWGFTHVNFLRYLDGNPFGYAGRNIPDLSLGFYGKRNTWEQHRSEAHTHDALEDTRGNAHALAHMIKDGLKIA